MKPFDNMFRCRKIQFLLSFLLLHLYMTWVVMYYSNHESCCWPFFRKENSSSSSFWSSSTSSSLENVTNTVTVAKSNTAASNSVASSFPPHNNVACPIPKLDPFHNSIKRFISTVPRSFNCTKKYPLLFNSTLDSMLIPLKNVEQVEKLAIGSCCYKTIHRQAGSTNDSTFQYSDTCYPISFVNSTVVPPHHEFLAIHCEYGLGVGNETISLKLMDTHAFVPLKPSVEERIKQIKENKPTVNDEKETVNVLILGLDSLSRMNFIRSMPQSHAFLMENLDAVEMQGYNIVGYNTLENMLVALTSRNQTEIMSTCEANRTFDNCPFIWKNFSEHGFITSFGEDAPTWGIFNNEMKGFANPPTDYYLRPFAQAGEKIMGIGDICSGPRLAWETLLDYTQKFAYSMAKHKRYFQLIFSTVLTHNGLNDGQLGDKRFISTLKWFQQGGYLNQTILVVLSDHGARFNPIVKLWQGQQEKRLPFMYFVVPPWFKKKYGRAYENMKANHQKLTTAYDLYETLVDLLSLKSITTQEIHKREKALIKHSSFPRGISHFLPIPYSRTCQMASIEDHYCICRSIKDISTNNSEVIEATKFAVLFINLFLVNFPQCSYLSLSTITSAKVSNGLVDDGVKQFLIFFTTVPNNASYEATVVQGKSGNWSVSGTIDRTNLYGNQSHCVDTNKEAKLYCYCMDLL